MRVPTRYNKRFFEQFPPVPVKLAKYNPDTKLLALDYQKKLDQLLLKFKVKSHLVGSILFKIEGKGEIDIRIYLNNENWYQVLVFLINSYKKIFVLEKDLAIFIDQVDNTPVEIVLMQGLNAQVEIKLTDYLKNHPQALKEYVQIKKAFSFSKREYMFQKFRFFKPLIESF